jgi:hypothetical protein
MAKYWIIAVVVLGLVIGLVAGGFFIWYRRRTQTVYYTTIE